MADIRVRLSRLVRALAREGLDGLLISNPVNIFYLTGFDFREGHLLVGPRCKAVITDSRYTEAAAKALPGFDLLDEPKERERELRGLIGQCRAKRIGFESASLSYRQYMRFRKILAVSAFKPLYNTVEELRQVKDRDELRIIRTAIRIAGIGFRVCRRRLKPGATEREIAAAFDITVKQKGAEGTGFDTIIAPAPRSSAPHYKIGPKRIGGNRPVIIDGGARVGGYNCDLTRVYFLGKIKSEFSRIYSIIRDAREKTIALIKPGIPAAEIDNAARSHINEKGYGDFFGHATGHGVGLDVHELPSISALSKDILKEGMVFTVEPGIYIPGLGGIRIEDMVLVKKGGCEVLTDDID